MTSTVSVDVVSDVVCPWCFVGKKQLERAVALVPDINVMVRWRPYQLDPTIPPGGTDRRAYMLVKFGDQNRIDQVHRRLEDLGAGLGIAFDFEAIEIAANTLDAHRLIRWAVDGDRPNAQDQVVRALFSAVFEEGRDIGSHQVLADIAAQAGLDVPVISALLTSGADVDAVQEEIAVAGQMGITGVPCFLLNQRYALMGAQDAQMLADALRQVAENSEPAAG